MIPSHVVVVLVFLAAGGLRLAAAEVPSTQRVISSLLRSAHDTVVEQMDDRPFRLERVDHPDGPWLESQFLTQATRAGREAVTSDAPVVVTVVYNDVSTRYELVEHSDSVRRVITVDLSAQIEHDGQRMLVTPEPAQDTIVCLRQDALAAESQQHQATHGEMPDPDRTIWDDVLEPAIFVVAAAATIVLLFTVRSQ
jgi:hypothetical protein